VAMDGSQYFHSTQIECPGCLRQTDAQGTVHDSHLVVGATLVRPGSHRVLPLDVEEVRQTDGTEKQDGSSTALEAADEASAAGASRRIAKGEWRMAN